MIRAHRPKAAMVLVVLVLLSLLVIPSNTAAQDGNDQLKIAFNGNDFGRNGNNGIYIVNEDGTGLTRITTGHDRFPDWSPDGSKIVFSTYDWDFADNALQLATVDADGSNLQFLTLDVEGFVHPKYSPDGTKIAFNGQTAGNEGLYIMDADGSNITRITSYDDRFPSWSPDGTKLVFATYQKIGGEGTHQIATINIDGTNKQVLTADPSGFIHPAWSPDGTMIAFNGQRGSQAGYVMNADGTNMRQLGGRYPTWSPDSSKIAYSNGYTIYTVNVDGSNQAVVAGSSGGYVFPSYQKRAPVVSPEEAIQDLIELVDSFNLNQGIDNSLDAKLKSAEKALEDINQNNDAAAMNSLQAFINAVEAQRGKALTDQQADSLVDAANAIIDLLTS